MRVLGGIVGMVMLAGCSTSGMVQAAFPDREMFSFSTADNRSVFTYACAPGEDASARASQAHRLTDQTMTAFADDAAEDLMAGIENGDSNIAMAIDLNRDADRMAEALQNTIETRFNCLLVDTRDV